MKTRLVLPSGARSDQRPGNGKRHTPRGARELCLGQPASGKTARIPALAHRGARSPRPARSGCRVRNRRADGLGRKRIAGRRRRGHRAGVGAPASGAGATGGRASGRGAARCDRLDRSGRRRRHGHRRRPPARRRSHVLRRRRPGAPWRRRSREPRRDALDRRHLQVRGRKSQLFRLPDAPVVRALARPRRLHRPQPREQPCLRLRPDRAPADCPGAEPSRPEAHRPAGTDRRTSTRGRSGSRCSASRRTRGRRASSICGERGAS